MTDASAAAAPAGAAPPSETSGQLGFPGMPTKLFSCTPSRLTAWVDCPRRYRMTYLDRPRPAPGPAWAHSSLGASVHNALANWWRLPRQRRTPAAAGELLETGWLPDGFRDDEQSAEWRARSKAMVESYVGQHFDADAEPLGVERTVATRTTRLALSGRVDRLDDRDGELVVVDYKTGRRAPGVDEARGSLALALYAVATSAMFRRPCRKVELHHLPSGDVVGWEHTTESLTRQVRRSEEIAGEIVAAASVAHGAGPSGEVGRPDGGPESDGGPASDPFPPRPGSQCGWCSLRAHCAEGRQAASARDPWAALGDATIVQ